MKRVETQISVIDLSLFQLFLEANKLDKIKVTHYGTNRSQYQIDNLICYSYDEEDTFITTILTYMTLKYGSLEMAFNDFSVIIRKIYNNGV